MLGFFASPGFVVLVLLFGPVAWALAIWAIIDAAGRPNEAFQAASTSKGLWITLVAVLTFLCGPFGVIASIIYLAGIRSSVKRAQESLRAGTFGGPGAPQAQRGAAPGWYPDPRDPSAEWYWDGQRYATTRKVSPPTPPPQPPSSPVR